MTALEKNLAQYITKGLRVIKQAHVQRHEDMASTGIPDVSYGLPHTDSRCGRGVEGWIELKRLPEWPKRAATPVRLPHYTAAQRLWLRLRGRLTGTAWLLLQVDRCWMLFDWKAAQEVGNVPRAALEGPLCTARWVNKVNFDELAAELVMRRQ